MVICYKSIMLAWKKIIGYRKKLFFENISKLSGLKKFGLTYNANLLGEIK